MTSSDTITIEVVVPEFLSAALLTLPLSVASISLAFRRKQKLDTGVKTQQTVDSSNGKKGDLWGTSPPDWGFGLLFKSYKFLHTDISWT